MVAIGTFSPSRRTNSVAASNTRSRLAAASLRSWRAGGMPMRIAVFALKRMVSSGTNRTKSSVTATRSSMSGLPDDDPKRDLTVARADDPDLLHLAVVGDTYTVLLSGEQTAGRFALIDMLIPAGGGPPPHRHDFEECFHVLEGSVEIKLRGGPAVRLWAGETVNIPSNAPHAFRNAGDVPARMLCTAVPAGLEAFFAEFGDRVDSRTASPPALTDEEKQARLRRAVERAPDYGMELLPPSG